jgi:plastocyanin
MCRPYLTALLGSVLALALADGAAAQAYGEGAGAQAIPQTDAREFYIATVHLDGRTGVTASADHPAEAFPSEALPAGGGLQLTPPDAGGAWRIRAFVFQPAQITVQAGDKVRLHFVGVQGPAHRIAVEGHEGVIELKRGQMRTVEVDAAEPGRRRFASLDRLPSMQGEVLVLPRP